MTIIHISKIRFEISILILIERILITKLGLKILDSAHRIQSNTTSRKLMQEDTQSTSTELFSSETTQPDVKYVVKRDGS